MEVDIKNIVTGVVIAVIAAFGSSFVTVKVLEERIKNMDEAITGHSDSLEGLRTTANNLNMFVAKAHPSSDTKSLIMANLRPAYESVVAIKGYAALTEGVEFTWKNSGPELVVVSDGKFNWSQLVTSDFSSSDYPVVGRLTQIATSDDDVIFTWNIYSAHGELISSISPSDFTKVANASILLEDEQN